MKIIVGSKSKHKVQAVGEAFADYGYANITEGIAVGSAVNEQPYGPDETLHGAEKRAEMAWCAVPEADVFVGIESGIINAKGRYFDMTYVAIAVQGHAQTFVGFAGGHEVDTRDFHAAIDGGFKTTTAGSKMAERTGCDGTDGTSWVSEGRVTRSSLIRDAVKIALGHARRAGAL